MLLDLPGREPVRPGKLLCIGRNYAKHAAEMKSAVPERPLVFLKPASALIGEGEAIRLPAASSEVHHEVELVAAIGKGGSQITEEEALSHVAGVAVGIDVTARDVQAQAKRNGHPWSVAKGYDTFAPLGRFSSLEEIGPLDELEIELSVDGEVRQLGYTRDMLFPLPRLIAYLSGIFTLEEGDLIYTGTPEGVGPLHDGEEVEASLTGCEPLRVHVTRPTS